MEILMVMSVHQVNLVLDAMRASSHLRDHDEQNTALKMIAMLERIATDDYANEGAHDFTA